MLRNDQLDQWDRAAFFHPSTHLGQFARGEMPNRIVAGGKGVYINDRDGNKLLDAFAGYRYPAEIGPGVYDIHSPRVPAVGEMSKLLHAAVRRLSADQIWVNPDCGLKTRQWPEVKSAIEHMVAAAHIARAAD